MTNKMAIRFEPARDDSGLWSLAAACTAFAGGGDTGENISIASGGELQQRASSSSPEACFDSYGQPTKYNGCLSVSGSVPRVPFPPPGLLSNIPIGVESFLAHGIVGSTHNAFGIYQPSRSDVDLVGAPTRRTRSIKESDTLSMRADGVEPMVTPRRHLSLTQVVTDAAIQDRVPRKANENVPLFEQNGAGRRIAQPNDLEVKPLSVVEAQRVQRRKSAQNNNFYATHKLPEAEAEQYAGKKKNGVRPTFSAQKSVSPEHSATTSEFSQEHQQITNAKGTSPSDNFGECDAAEALLNLCTAIPPQSTQDLRPQMDMASTSHQKGDLPYHDRTEFQTTPGLRKCQSFDDYNAKSMQDVEATERSGEPCVQDHGDTAGVNQRSGLHFKKAICRKFAELKDQGSLQASTEANKTNDGDPHSCVQSDGENGAGGNADQKESGNRWETVFADGTRANVELNTAESACQAPHHQTSVSGTHRGQGDIANVSQSKPSILRKIPTAATEGKKPERSSNKSNLYRITTTLGSSSESLSASEEDNADVASDSESSSLYTSESDGDDSQHSEDESPAKPAQESYASSPTSQDSNNKSRFVLSKPKFSLPARVDHNKTTQHAQQASSSTLSFANINSTFMPRVGTDVSFSPADLPSTQAKSSCKRISPLSKQSSHIKKATFKFHSSANTTQTGSKDDQSQGANHTTNNELSPGLMTKSGFALKRKLFSAKGTQAARLEKSNDSKTAPVFGTYKGGVSFELLSTETSGDTFQNATSASKSKSHSALQYDKRRLPQPTARSPALEAKQLEKLKPGRKRKSVSKALNFASSQKASRTNVSKGNSVDSYASEQVGNKTLSRLHCGSSHDYSSTSSGDTGCWKTTSGTVDEVASSASGRSSSLETCSSASVTSSSRTSSLAGDEPPLVENGRILARGTKSHRSSSRNLKRLALRNKRKRSGARECSVRTQPADKHETYPIEATVSDKTCTEDVSSSNAKAVNEFRLLSCFPVPASLTAGPARGELIPCPGSSVVRIPPRLAPFRWSKGLDVREMKQKRQRERWRHLTLDMFCMGAGSR